jgi:hypothetical protein
MRTWAETAFIVHNPLGLQNASVFPDKLFLVRMRAAILQNLADTAIREAIACCIHVLRLGKGFTEWILVKKWQRSRVSTYVLYFVCSLCCSLDFFYANGRGGQGRANAMP